MLPCVQAQAASALRTLSLHLRGRTANTAAQRNKLLASCLLIYIVSMAAPAVYQQSGIQQLQLLDSEAAIVSDFSKAFADRIQQTPSQVTVSAPDQAAASMPMPKGRWQQALAMSSPVVNAARALLSITPPAASPDPPPKKPRLEEGVHVSFCCNSFMVAVAYSLARC